MKRFTKLFVSAIALSLLSSCEMLSNLIPGNKYSGYDEFRKYSQSEERKYYDCYINKEY